MQWIEGGEGSTEFRWGGRGGREERGIGGMDGGGNQERAGGRRGLGMHWSLQTFHFNNQEREGGNENAEIGESSGHGSGRRAARAARSLGMGNTMGLH